MMNTSTQSGLSLFGWLGVLVIAVSAITLLLKLGPHYLDFRTLHAAVDSVPAGQVHQMSKAEVRDVLEKRFRINNLRDVPLKDALTIERDRDQTMLVFSYEKREHIVANIYAVLAFDETWVFQ